MKYLLDTNICVFFLRGKYDIDKKINSVGIDNCCLSEITLAELIYGAYCSKDPKNNLFQVFQMETLFEIIPISECLETYAKDKHYLRLKGLPIDDFDLLIGATAKKYNLRLVTDNLKHFERLNLQIENWITR